MQAGGWAGQCAGRAMVESELDAALIFNRTLFELFRKS